MAGTAGGPPVPPAHARMVADCVRRFVPGRIDAIALAIEASQQWPRRLGRTLTRVDFWSLIVGIIGLVIAYLTLVKPG
jgi:hypothetical protein